MPHALILAHMQNTRYLHGGAVYRESIRAMLATGEPALAVDELFVHPQHHRLWRLWRQVFDVLTSPFSKYPAKVNHFRTRDFRLRVLAALAVRPYRLFVINGAEMLWTLDLLPPGVPLLYISHNIEHRLYQQQVARHIGVLGLSRLLKADAEKFKDFEIDRLRRLKMIIAITDDDRKALETLAPQARVVTIPPSFDYPPWRRKVAAPGEGAGPGGVRRGPLRLGFLGNLEWWPNRRSLSWFVDEVWPKVRGFELHLYGQGSEAMSDRARIVGHGFVRDLGQVWEGVELMIQPITCGAGVNIKVAESLYNRMPMVATPLAVRGIALRDDPAIRILETAREWIDYLNGPGPEKQARLTARKENVELFNFSGNALLLKKLLRLNPSGGLGRRRQRQLPVAPGIEPLPGEPQTPLSGFSLLHRGR